MELSSTGGSPSFKPDNSTPTNTNEPYLEFLNFFLNEDSIPQVLSTSYGDDEQTVRLDRFKSSLQI
jgi:tripeptidyl-peptidase I